MKRLFYFLLFLFSVTTIAAQTLIKDINIGMGNANPCNFVRLGNLTCFIANDGQHGYELWVTDGTEAGTTMVKDIDPGPADGCMYHALLSQTTSVLQVLGNRVYFFANDGSHGFELWSSDGTELGTHILKDILPGQVSASVNLSLTKAGNYLFFAADDGAHGTELWKTNGTDTGTVLIKDIFTGPQSGNPLYLFADSNMVYFAAVDKANGYGLWKSDGTDTGTVYLKRAAPAITHDDSLPYAKVNNEIYFCGQNGEYGAELWKTNGTPEGTVLVKDINPGNASAWPSQFCVYNGHLIFTATTKADGKQLWQSDGTEQGTTEFKIPKAGKEDGYTGKPVILKGHAYFIANDSTQHAALWVTDLTDTGTHIFSGSFAGQKHYGNLWADIGLIYFASDSASFGLELWKTDGTTAGTAMQNEICPGACGSGPNNFFRNDTMLFFSAYDDTHGNELWAIGANIPFIQEITSEKLKDVYIDPLKRKLNLLRTTGSDVAYIIIYNLNGDELYTQLTKEPNQISSESFKPGIYILRAYDKNDEMVSFVRFVKE